MWLASPLGGSGPVADSPFIRRDPSITPLAESSQLADRRDRTLIAGTNGPH